MVGSEELHEDARKGLGVEKDKISGLILDLRNNGGGSLMMRLIPPDFLSTRMFPGKNSSGVQRILSDEDSEIAHDGPLVVLVNQFSASASRRCRCRPSGLWAGGDYRRSAHSKAVQTIVDMNENIPSCVCVLTMIWELSR